MVVMPTYRIRGLPGLEDRPVVVQVEWPRDLRVQWMRVGQQPVEQLRPVDAGLGTAQTLRVHRIAQVGKTVVAPHVGHPGRVHLRASHSRPLIPTSTVNGYSNPSREFASCPYGKTVTSWSEKYMVSDEAVHSRKLPRQLYCAIMKNEPSIPLLVDSSMTELPYSADDVSGVATHAVRGKFTPLAALGRMLERSRLRAWQDGKTDAITITAVASSRAWFVFLGA